MPCLFWVHVQFEYTLMFFGRCFSTAEFWEGGPMKKIQSGRHWEVIRSFTTCLGFIVWLDFRTYTQDHHMNLIKANFKFTNHKGILNHVVDLGISKLSFTRNNEEKYRLFWVGFALSPTFSLQSVYRSVLLSYLTPWTFYLVLL